ncbi:hypothetical protein PQG75_08085 [Corynebacterium pseudodiphtheriticum]|uniref:hypothetical protein n=1 Tax=Corynebacterium pseudodiphtheriticum TaxID=37637 RepID=UPI00223BBF16|nr:hypothetical protein [Corynebacterium pseudodiphtheriticum]MCT1635875.1 hypothetical protein [Corynebacterium pseudodiphtheriticum]MCT1666852.1 hypothetical protein [Corynebacterium pseudodiphtheriticum]MDC7113308.1 hypothetical protein [Corynebacterium pseudodiphtheriticum]
MPGFLIEYYRRRGAVKVEKFDSLAEAMEERLIRDQKNLDEDLEIVTVASKSREQLEKSHSRYFVSA